MQCLDKNKLLDIYDTELRTCFYIEKILRIQYIFSKLYFYYFNPYLNSKDIDATCLVIYLKIIGGLRVFPTVISGTSSNSSSSSLIN